MAQPSYDDNGELLDGGFDMSTGGVCGCVSLCPPLCVRACVCKMHAMASYIFLSKTNLVLVNLHDCIWFCLLK